MDTEIKNNNNNVFLPIHQKIYNRLIAENKESLTIRELENIILNTRFNDSQEIDYTKIRKNLADIGLTKNNIDKVCRYIPVVQRINAEYLYSIKKTLRKHDLIYYKNHRAYIKKP